MIYFFPLLIIQLRLPQTHAAPIENSLLNVTASGTTPSPPASVDECSLQSATARALCTIEQTLADSHLLNVSYVHHTPEGADTANAQNLDSSISPSTVNKDMTIFKGLGGVVALFALCLGVFAKLYWDKPRSTNASSNTELELELDLSGSQTA